MPVAAYAVLHIPTQRVTAPPAEAKSHCPEIRSNNLLGHDLKQSPTASAPGAKTRCIEIRSTA